MIKNSETKTKKTLEVGSNKNKKVESKIGDTVDLVKIRLLIDSIENEIYQLKELLMLSDLKVNTSHLPDGKDGKSIEGAFDGESMIDKNGKKYSVSQNYASKSKLVTGDILKLTISSDGGFIYKQIGPVERKNIIGKVSKSGNKYFVTFENKKYNILLASITYFKIKVGDRVTIIVPKDKESNWATIENVIEKGK